MSVVAQSVDYHMTQRSHIEELPEGLGAPVEGLGVLFEGHAPWEQPFESIEPIEFGGYR